MTNSKAITKPDKKCTQLQKVPHFSAAALMRAQNARASARLLEAMEFVKAGASVARCRSQCHNDRSNNNGENTAANTG